MALPAGRKGVNSKSVDHYGNVIGGGGGSGSYTKQESDAKYEPRTNIGGFMFREEDGQPQYKSPTGEWVNFSSGGGIGFNVPEPTTENLSYRYTEYVSGGYQVDNNVCYIDITVTLTVNLSGQAFIQGFPHPIKNVPKVVCYCDGVDISAYLERNGDLTPSSQLTGGTTYRIIGYYNV